MSFRLKLEGNQKWYTNRDTIKGIAYLDTRSSLEISSLSVVVFGISRTALTRVDDVGQKFTDNVEESSAFLHLEEKLFPPPGHQYGAKYSLRPGTHSWPFKFELPSHTTCIGSYPLPPSLSDLDSDTASIRYFVEVEYERPPSSSSTILGTNSKSLKNYFKFLPSDGKCIDHVPTYGAFHSRNARVVASKKTVSGIFSRLVSTLDHDRIPVCSDVVDFIVSCELLLTPGLKFSWNLDAVEFKPNEETVHVTAIKIQLITKSSIRAKNVDSIFEHHILLLKKHTLKLIAGDITSQLGSNSLVVPESVPPTFSAPSIKREYIIEFRIKWTHKPGSDSTHKTTLSKPVYIRSGMPSLPNYETGDIIRTERDFPQAKSYYK